MLALLCTRILDTLGSMQSEFQDLAVVRERVLVAAGHDPRSRGGARGLPRRRRSRHCERDVRLESVRFAYADEPVLSTTRR